MELTSDELIGYFEKNITPFSVGLQFHKGSRSQFIHIIETDESDPRDEQGNPILEKKVIITTIDYKLALEEDGTVSHVSYSRNWFSETNKKSIEYLLKLIGMKIITT